MNQSNKGITLVALVVTIIVLLILAGITISLVIGQNGIITRAKEAQLRQENATVLENLSLKVVDINIGFQSTGTNGDRMGILKEKGYIDANGIVNVESTVGKKLSTGNGTTNDIYKIEEGNLNYYDKEGDKTELGELWGKEEGSSGGATTMGLKETDASLFDFDPSDGSIIFKNSESYYYMGSDGIVHLGDLDFPVEVVVIPSEINGQKVKKIGRQGVYAGLRARNIRSIIVPADAQIIDEDVFGDGFFYGRDDYRVFQRKDNTLPIKAIQEYEASYSNVLLNEELVVEGTYVYNKEKTKLVYAFEASENIILPDTVTVLGERAFEKISLKNIVIPAGIIEVEADCFESCLLLEKITIPNTVEKFYSYVFYGSDALKEIVIEAGSTLEVPSNKWGAPETCIITKL